MDIVEISGIRYVKASDAAKKMGYTSDYVGQLCRAGKIPSRRVGRTWYVEEGALSGHREENARSNKQKTKELIEEELLKAEYERGRIHQSVYVPNFSPAYRKRLLETPIAYKADEHPLFPQIKEKHLDVEQESDATEEVSVDIRNEEPLVRRIKAAPEEIVESAEEQEPQQIFTLTEGEIPVYAVEDDEEVETPQEESVFVAAVAPQAEEEVVLSPLTNVSLARRPVLSIIPISATVLGLLMVGMTLFLQNVWVYQAGNGTVAERPNLQATYGVTAMSTVVNAISRESEKAFK